MPPRFMGLNFETSCRRFLKQHGLEGSHGEDNGRGIEGLGTSTVYNVGNALGVAKKSLHE